MRILLNNYKYCLLSILFIMPYIGFAQTEYWFVAPDVSYKHSASDRPVFVMITTGALPSTVTIDIPALASFTPITKTVAENSSWKYIFTDIDPTDIGTLLVENSVTTAGTVTNKGMHITSTEPISAYYQVDGNNAKEFFSLKGDKALGKEFYTPFQTEWATNGWYSDAYQQIHIVATEDNTNVKICAKSNFVGGNAADTLLINLNKGQTYLIRQVNIETVAGVNSLNGTYIKADKNIAVTLLDDALRVGGSTDPAGDQITPIGGLGTNYVVTKGKSITPLTDNIYILATKNDTEIFENGISKATINRGETHKLPLTSSASYISTNFPVYCWHQSGIGAEIGAAILPSMYSISSRRVAFYKQNITTNNLFIVFRQDVLNNFTINDNPITLVASPVPGLNSWLYAEYNITGLEEGVCVIRNTKGAFSLGYFSGNTSNTSLYGYLSNFGTFAFSSDTVYKCFGDTYVLDGGYAKGYQWWETEGSIISTDSVFNVTTPGCYKLKVDQDPYYITDSIWVLDRYFDALTVCYNNDKVWIEERNNTTSKFPKSYEWVWNSGSSTKDSIDLTTLKESNSLTVKVTDIELGCDTTLLIQILVALNDTVSMFANVNDTIIDILDNDIFGACNSTNIEFGITKNSTNGTTNKYGNKIKYSPNSGFAGKEIVEYYIKCGSDIATANIYIEVKAAPEIILTDSCSFSPQLNVNIKVSGDAYKWEYSTDNVTWTDLGINSSSCSEKKEGYYKVTVTHARRGTVTTKTKKLTILQSKVNNRIWYQASLK